MNEELYKVLEWIRAKFINRQIYRTDGAPEGNQNAAGPHRKRGGSQVTGEKARKSLKSALKSGTISTKLDSKKQSKHHEGSKLYNKAVKKGQHVSTLSIPDKEADDIIKKFSGTGQTFEQNGQYKETVDTGKIIGTYKDRQGNASETTRVTIHYSKSGAHIVPARPGKKK